MICPHCGDQVNFSKRRGKFYCAECELEIDSPPKDSITDINSLTRTNTSLKLFLSYGRDDFSEEILALRDALRKRGHEVWFDEEQLASGLDWEHRIEQGLKWCDKVVLTMTPHSVRRPDGYCLNEIAKALESQKLIIPVLLVDLPNGAPTSICRIQYLDWRDAVPSDKNTERFLHHLHRLCDAIENNKLDFEGGQQRLQRYLQPLSYDGDIRRHVTRFVGRHSLLKRLQTWLFDPRSSQILWLTGAPGLGKSAIAAWLAHRWAETYAMHFCITGNKDKTDPVKTILSIAYQLSQHLDLYRERLSNIDLERESCKADAKTLFETLLAVPFSKDYSSPSNPCFVIMDGVDEATNQDGSNQLAELIATDWKKLPRWIKLIVSSRPDAEVQQWLGGIESISLSGTDEEQMKDLHSYLDQELKALGKSVSNEILDQILKASEGTFHYIVLLLEDIKNGRCNPENPVELPVGMNSFYLQSFYRRFKDINEYKHNCRPLLSLILASPEPLALQIMAMAQNTSAFEIRERLQRLGSMVSIEPAENNEGMQWDSVRLAHASLGNWLTSLDERRMPTAQGFTVQPSNKELTETVLTLWEKYQAQTDNKVNEFVARNLWDLLQKNHEFFTATSTKQYLSSERFLFEKALSLSNYWKNKNSRLALEPSKYAANVVLKNIPTYTFKDESDFKNFKILDDLSGINRQLGKYEEALAILQKIKTAIENTNKQKYFFNYSQEILGKAYLDTGAILTDILKDTLASEEYNKALHIFESLAKSDPSNVNYLYEIGKINYMIGGSFQAVCKLDTSLIYYKKSKEIFSNLLAKFPEEFEYRLESAGMHLWIGAILELKGSIKEAIIEFNEGKAALFQLIENNQGFRDLDSNSANELQWYWTVSQQYLAGALEMDRQIAEASLVYDENLKSAQKLLSYDIYNISYKRELACSFAGLAHIYLLKNDLPSASKFLEQAYFFFKQLKSSSDPGSEFDCAVVAALGAEIAVKSNDSSNAQRFDDELTLLIISSNGISVGLFRVRLCQLLIKRLKIIQSRLNIIESDQLGITIAGLEEWFTNIDKA